MKRIISKDYFLTILARQQANGLSIKGFCDNEAYPASCFYYWKSKHGLTRSCSPGSHPSHAEFAAISFPWSSSALSKGLPYEGSSDGTITIEFPNGVKIHFRDISESGTALQVITQRSHHYVLPECPPTDDALRKSVWLAISEIEKK